MILLLSLLGRTAALSLLMLSIFTFLAAADGRAQQGVGSYDFSSKLPQIDPVEPK